MSLEGVAEWLNDANTVSAGDWAVHRKYWGSYRIVVENAKKATVAYALLHRIRKISRRRRLAGQTSGAQEVGASRFEFSKRWSSSCDRAALTRLTTERFRHVATAQALFFGRSGGVHGIR
jgi:hypothetical protein